MPNPEFHRISPRISVWRTDDPTVKTGLFSTTLAAPNVLFLIDPVALVPDQLEEAVGGELRSFPARVSVYVSCRKPDHYPL